MSSFSALGSPKGVPKCTVTAGYVVEQNAENTPSAQEIQTLGYDDAEETLPSCSQALSSVRKTTFY